MQERSELRRLGCFCPDMRWTEVFQVEFGYQYSSRCFDMPMWWIGAFWRKVENRVGSNISSFSDIG